MVQLYWWQTAKVVLRNQDHGFVGGAFRGDSVCHSLVVLGLTLQDSLSSAHLAQLAGHTGKLWHPMQAMKWMLDVVMSPR